MGNLEEKPQTNTQTDKQTNGQTYGAYFIKPSLHVSNEKSVAAELNNFFTKVVDSLNLHEFASDLTESILIRLIILFQNPKLAAAL